MASAWGVSWGAYWGNSWGSVATEPSGGGGGGKRRRRVYIEREGKILLFDTPRQASNYLQSLKPEVSVKVKKKAPEPKVIEIKALQEFAEIKDYQENVVQLIKSNDLEILMSIIFAYENWLEEQNIEVLLLLH